MSSEATKALHSSFVVEEVPESSYSGIYYQRWIPMLLFVPYFYFQSNLAASLYAFCIPLTLICVAHWLKIRYSRGFVNNWTSSGVKFDESNYGHLVRQVVGPLALSHKETRYMIYADLLDANETYEVTVPELMKKSCYWFGLTAIDQKCFVFTSDVIDRKYTCSKLSIIVSRDEDADIVVPSSAKKFRLILRCYRPTFEDFLPENTPTVEEVP